MCGYMCGYMWLHVCLHVDYAWEKNSGMKCLTVFKRQYCKNGKASFMHNPISPQYPQMLI